MPRCRAYQARRCIGSPTESFSGVSPGNQPSAVSYQLSLLEHAFLDHTQRSGMMTTNY
jgi:hypothetical protein